MKPEQAREILRSATLDDDGTFTTLRRGQEPSESLIRELRLALRVLWRHWKSQDALPFDICRSAAMILHFYWEARQNIEHIASGRRPIWDSLSDLELGAFELLCGRVAESFTVHRPDLGG